MGEALVRGLCEAGWASPSDLLVVDSSEQRRRTLGGPDGLAAAYPGLEVCGPDDLDGEMAEAALIAVKPGDVADACVQVVRLGARRVLSVAAGVTIDSLERWVAAPADPPGPADPAGAAGRSVPAHLSAATPAVIRAMPNTPALIRAGVAAISGGTNATEADLLWGEAVLGAVGVVVRVPEPSLDAVTGLSGSGPAYLFLVVEALIDAGVFVGLPRPVATELTLHTVLGAARMLVETGQDAESLRAAVTSPGGTTAAGLRALEAAAVRSAIIDAVVAAAERSRQMGGH
jgi:pyrroline-5-carboxylate reductase